jgi:hypothetical protein
MRLPTAKERRVRLLQRDVVLIFGPEAAADYLRRHLPALGTTPGSRSAGRTAETGGGRMP